MLRSLRVGAASRARVFSAHATRIARADAKADGAVAPAPLAASGSAPTADASKPDGETPPPSSFRSRFTWFLSGVAITAIGFSLVLRQDVLTTSQELRKTIDSLHSDVILQENETKRRLKALEAVIKK